MRRVIIFLLVTAIISFPFKAGAEWCDIREESCRFAYVGLIPGLPLVALASLVDGRENGVIVAAVIGYSIFFVLTAPFVAVVKIFEKSTSNNVESKTEFQNDKKFDSEYNGQKGG